MTDKEKLEKLKKLADAMYYAAQHLTTDASRLHEAMDEYHQFIINEYHKEEVSEYLEEAANFYADTHTEWFDADNNPHVSPAFKAGANWQKEQMMAKAIDVTIAIPYPNSDGGYSQIVDSKEALPFGGSIKVLIIKED